VYVSDGSEDELEDVDVVLSGSRMGLMRRGLVHPSALLQPNRQWTRSDAATAVAEGEAFTEDETRLRQEEELAKLDPAERAARLQQEKLRKEEEAVLTERQKESEENAGRDPALFSKRTAFDIRFDQIEEKPWARGTGDFADFFNYGLAEEDWLEYAEQQMMIRQELIDASKQKRAPDPTIVPVTPKAPVLLNSALPRADGIAEGEDADSNAEVGPALGPILVKKEDSSLAGPAAGPDAERDTEDVDIDVGKGGAWGAGAAPGSYLARLIEEQENGSASKTPPPPSENAGSYHGSNYGDNDATGGHYGPASDNDKPRGARYGAREQVQAQNDYYGESGGHYGGAYPPQSLPPPSSSGFRGGRGGRGYNSGGRGFEGGRAGRGGWEDRGGGSEYLPRKRSRDWRR
jgi:hypothetical protein